MDDLSDMEELAD